MSRFAGLMSYLDQKNFSSSPKIGIFWIDPLTDNVIYSEESDIKDSDPSVNEVTSERYHREYWEVLKQAGLLSEIHSKLPFDKLPRGRITWVRNENKYYIMTGNYIKTHPKAIENILKNYKIPKDNYELDIDVTHYRN